MAGQSRTAPSRMTGRHLSTYRSRNSSTEGVAMRSIAPSSRIGRNLTFPHQEVGLSKDPFQTVRADFPHTAYGRSWLDVMRHYAASGYATLPESLCNPRRSE